MFKFTCYGSGYAGLGERTMPFSTKPLFNQVLKSPYNGWLSKLRRAVAVSIRGAGSRHREKDALGSGKIYCPFITLLTKGDKP